MLLKRVGDDLLIFALLASAGIMLVGGLVIVVDGVRRLLKPSKKY